MKISTKISVSVISTTILAVLLISVAIVFFVEKNIKNDAERMLQAIIEREANEIEKELSLSRATVNIFQEILLNTMDLDMIKESQQFTDDYENSILDVVEAVADASSNKNIWFQGNTRELKNLVNLSVMEKNGSFIRNEKWDVIGSSHEQDDWWAGPIESGRNWTDPYQWNQYCQGTIVVSYGEKLEKDGKFLGVAGIDYKFKKLKDKIADFKLFETGYLVLFDEELNFLYHPNKNFKSINDIPNELETIFTDELILKNKDQAILKYKYNKKNKLFMYKRLSNGWILGAAPVINEMFKTVHHLEDTVLIVAITVLIVGFIISQIVGKSISKPIKAMAIEFGNFSYFNSDRRHACIKAKISK